MTQEAKVLIGIGVLSLAILFGGVFFLSKSGQQETKSTAVDPSILTRNDTHKISSSSAKVTIVEFADFQCPACGSVHPTIKRILKDYTGKINFIYRHFPLPQHQNAIRAAKAAEAAASLGGQEKFWEMSDILYDKQAMWSDSTDPTEIFVTYAKDLRLDTHAFSDLLSQDRYDTIIQQDKNDGIALGVNATPTLFINNEKFVDVPTYENLKNSIEEKLQQ